jgi:hypothetical protein
MIDECQPRRARAGRGDDLAAPRRHAAEESDERSADRVAAELRRDIDTVQRHPDVRRRRARRHIDAYEHISAGDQLGTRGKSSQLEPAFLRLPADNRRQQDGRNNPNAHVAVEHRLPP